MMANLRVKEESRVAARRPRILLVDDHEAACRSLSRLLEALGYDVTAVNDGLSALDRLRSDPAFDYVLTDVRLPDVDGREIVVEARQLNPTPRIALITGWDLDEDEPSRLGIDWIFLKPLDVREIVAKLRQCPPPDLAPDLD